MPARVSIIVTSFNHERYIGRLIESIIDQSFDDFEVVVVDDGSSDSSVEILEEFALSYPRIKIYPQSNQGVVSARNRGITLSVGEFITILDSDDLISPDRLSLQVQALEGDSDALFVFGDAWLIDESGDRFGRFSDYYPVRPGELDIELFLNYCFIPAISVMFRRRAIELTGPFWGPGPSCDYLKWIEFAHNGQAVYLRNPPLGSWRIHKKNTFSIDLSARIANYMKLKEALEIMADQYPTLKNKLGHRLPKRYARCHFMAGVYAAIENCWPLARDHYEQAMKLDASLLNITAVASTYPILNHISAYFYRIAKKKVL